MGIQGLTKLLSENTKGALREVKFESYFGRKVAIDASMHIYQFMVLSPPLASFSTTFAPAHELEWLTNHLRAADPRLCPPVRVPGSSDNARRAPCLSAGRGRSTG